MTCLVVESMNDDLIFIVWQNILHVYYEVEIGSMVRHVRLPKID